MNMEHLIDRVIQWGQDRNIIGGATALQQQEKLEEEVKEIRDGLEADNGTEIMDGIGDATVVLILQAAILGIRFEDCLALAYDTIKDRKGRMIDGKFVKESDLIKRGLTVEESDAPPF